MSDDAPTPAGPAARGVLGLISKIGVWWTALGVLGTILGTLYGGIKIGVSTIQTHQHDVDTKIQADKDQATDYAALKAQVSRQATNITSLRAAIDSCAGFINSQTNINNRHETELYGGNGIKGLRADMIDVDQRLRSQKEQTTADLNTQASVEKADVNALLQRFATWDGRWDWLQGRVSDQSIPIVTKGHK